MAEQDEVGDRELPDVVEPQLSAFAELFREHEKMKVIATFNTLLPHLALNNLPICILNLLKQEYLCFVANLVVIGC